MSVLQDILLPPAGAPEGLYLRCRSDEFLCSIKSVADHESAGVQLSAGQTLNTDTFFNCFYLAYWYEFASLREVALRVTMKGAGRLRLFEARNGALRLLAEHRLEALRERTADIPIPTRQLDVSPFETDEPKGRIFFEFTATKATTLKDMAFVTQAAPTRDCTLSIGLCTFNQEKYFTRTLTRISELLARRPEVTRVFVVNQGEPFQSEALLKLLENDRITLIEQRNLGGCGGFTRTLLEAQTTETPATHHLLMDDDIILDERIIERCLQFLPHASQEIAVGAGMLDSLRPGVMYEAGAFLEPSNKIVPYCHNVDVSDAAHLSHFDNVVKTDYNAWWFCMVPLTTSKDIGLPAPVFIRGDDFEYGQRLAREGVPTVTLPGIGVWHEPFYAKAAGWQSYYDLRNRLIFGATYSDKVRPLSMLHMINMLVTPILTHQYNIAALRARAVEDYFAGPEAVFKKDGEEIHKEIAALNKQLAPRARSKDEFEGQVPRGGKPMPAGRLGLMRVYCAAILTTLFKPFSRAPHLMMDADVSPRNVAGSAYVMTNGMRSFHLEMSPDRGLAIKQLKIASRLLRRYKAERVRTESLWSDRILPYRKPDFWKQVFSTQTKGA